MAETVDGQEVEKGEESETSTIDDKKRASRRSSTRTRGRPPKSKGETTPIRKTPGAKKKETSREPARRTSKRTRKTKVDADE